MSPTTTTIQFFWQNPALHKERKKACVWFLGCAAAAAAWLGGGGSGRTSAS